MPRVFLVVLLAGCAMSSEEFQGELDLVLCEQGTACESWEAMAYCDVPESAAADPALEACTFDVALARECLDGEFVCRGGYLERPAPCEQVYSGCDAPAL